MKALSIMQPWASLLVSGEKKIETRHWATKHRGIILIHSSRRFTAAQQNLATLEPFHTALTRHNSQLIQGYILGFVTITDCLPTQSLEETLSSQERQFGDYGPGRWAWTCKDATPLKQPIRAQGSLSLFEVPDHWLRDQLCEEDKALLFPDDAQSTLVTIDK